jgi:hypothetical protein
MIIFTINLDPDLDMILFLDPDLAPLNKKFLIQVDPDPAPQHWRLPRFLIIPFS